MFEEIAEFFGLTQRRVPVVGICGGNADSASVRAMFTQIQSAGATPLFLGNHAKRDAAADIEKIDALVVMGNNADIDPKLYGQQPYSKTISEIATPEGKARAEYEYKLMRLALDQKMPLLGVCGGMQRLNVMCGGSLHQHVPDITGNDDHAQQDHNIAPFIPVQLVTLLPGSKLHEIAKNSNINRLYTPARRGSNLNPIIAENSMHHQAVDKVGDGLRVAAISQELDKNGNPVSITEAIEADKNGPYGNQFLAGVQWHPEFSASPLGALITGRVVREAAHYASLHQRSHPMSEAVEENVVSALPSIRHDPNLHTRQSGVASRILAMGQTRA